MSQFIILYNKNKSSIRALMQKLFLKLLLKIFPKRFLYYKKKIKEITNKIRHLVFYETTIIFLRIKHLRYFHLPSRHIYLIYELNKFLEILKMML